MGPFFEICTLHIILSKDRTDYMRRHLAEKHPKQLTTYFRKRKRAIRKKYTTTKKKQIQKYDKKRRRERWENQTPEERTHENETKRQRMEKIRDGWIIIDMQFYFVSCNTRKDTYRLLLYRKSIHISTIILYLHVAVDCIINYMQYNYNVVLFSMLSLKPY